MSAFCDALWSRAPVRTINAPHTLTTASDSSTIFTQYAGSVIFQLWSSQNLFQISTQLLCNPHVPRLAHDHTSDCMLMRFYLGAEFPPEAQTLVFDNEISSQLSSVPISASFALSSHLPPFTVRLLSCSGPSVAHIIISENTNTTAQMGTAAPFHRMNS